MDIRGRSVTLGGEERPRLKKGKDLGKLRLLMGQKKATSTKEAKEKTRKIAKQIICWNLSDLYIVEDAVRKG